MALITCSECSKTVSDKAPYCPHCGAPQGQGAQAGAPPPIPPQAPTATVRALTSQAKGMSLGKKFLVGVAGAFVIVFILASLAGSNSENGGSGSSTSAVRAASTSAPTPAASTAAQLVAHNMPGDEAAFVAIVKRATDAYRAAGSNELQAGAARPVRAKALCEALRSTQVRNWTGTVRTLSTNGDGKGVILIKLSDGTTVGTWNNAFSDIGDATLVDPSSPVYRAALGLKVGAAVSFSGELRRSSDSDCFREQSMTMNGSMTDPIFLMRFSALAPLTP